MGMLDKLHSNALEAIKGEKSESELVPDGLAMLANAIDKINDRLDEDRGCPICDTQGTKEGTPLTDTAPTCGSIGDEGDDGIYAVKPWPVPSTVTDEMIEAGITLMISEGVQHEHMRSFVRALALAMEKARCR